MALKLDAGPLDDPPAKPLSSYRAKMCLESLRKDLEYDRALKVEDDAFTASIKQLGIDFEAEMGERLATWDNAHVIPCTETTTITRLRSDVAAARKVRVAVIEVDDSHHGQLCAEAVTHAICERPGKVAVIWDAHLRRWKQLPDGSYEWGQRSGKPDALVLTGPASRPTWAGVDVKCHKVLGGKSKAQDWEFSSLSDHMAMTTVSAKGPFKKSDALQLAHYQRMLEFHGLAGEAKGGIIGTVDSGLPEDQIIWIDLDAMLFDRKRASALDVHDAAFAEAWAVAQRSTARLTDKRKRPLTRPEWKSECKTCAWREVCHEELVADDHPTLLPGVSVAVARTLRDAKVHTVADLALLDTRTAEVLGHGVEQLPKIIVKARKLVERRKGRLSIHTITTSDDGDALLRAGVSTVAQAAGLCEVTATIPSKLDRGASLTAMIDQARVTDYARRRKSTHLYLARNVESLTLPDAVVEYHVDMEEDERIYMWGVRVETRTATSVTTEYVPFETYEHTPESEARVFAEFWTWMQAGIKKASRKYGADKVKVYHYTAAEDRCMRHIVKQYSDVDGVPSSDELEAFLASDHWVDLYPVLAKEVLWPTEDHTLKTLAKYVRFVWRDQDPSGANSQIWYRNACDPSLSDEERQLWQERLQAYNEDDVAATGALVSFFRRLLSVHNPTAKLPSVAALEPHYKRRRRALT